MQNISLYLGEHGKLATSGRNLWERCYHYQNYDDCNECTSLKCWNMVCKILMPQEIYINVYRVGLSPLLILGLITKEINGVNTKDNHLLCPHCSKDVDKIGSKGVY